MRDTLKTSAPVVSAIGAVVFALASGFGSWYEYDWAHTNGRTFGDGVFWGAFLVGICLVALGGILRVVSHLDWRD